MIHVLAQIETVPGRREEFLAEFSEVAILVRKEVWCLEYGAAIDYQTDISLQKCLGDNVVLIIEKWDSTEHLKMHLVAPHMTDYRNRIKSIVQGITLRVLEPKV